MAQYSFFPSSFFYNCQKLSKSAVVGSCFFLVGQAFANSYTDASNANAFLPYTPGVSITGLSGDLTTGYGDAMLPLAGQSTGFFYVDPQALYHNGNDYSAALGLGGRKLTDNGLLGAYVFGDYNHSPAGHSFWFVSPGVERLGDTVDFSANVYIPTGSQRVATGSAFGSDLDDYDSVSFVEHTEYDQLFNTYESVGVGEDVQFGFRLPVKDSPKIYLGGYHFSPKDAQDITGGVARLELPVTDRLDVDVSEGYDNWAHNTVKVGLAYHFGGRHTPQRFSGDLTQRMVDPIQRNLIAVGGGSHTAQPILRQTKATGDFGVVMDDISFFLPDDPAPGVVTGEGTYEHPYIGLNQSNVDDANSKGNTNFFFNGNLGPYVSTTEIDLDHMNDSLYGRQSYKGRLFVQPASGNNRPVIDFENSEGGGDNGFVWMVASGNSDIVVTSIRITGGPGDGNGSAMLLDNEGAGEVSMKVNNTDISNTQFISAIFAKNDGGGILNLLLNTSTLNNNSGDGLDLEESGAGSVMNAAINFSSLSGNGLSGFDVFVHDAMDPVFNLAINRSTFDNNVSDGAILDLLSNTNAQTNVVIRHSTFNNNIEGDGLDVLDSHNPNSILNIAIDASQFNGNNASGFQVQQTAENGELFNLFIKKSSFNGNINTSFGTGMILNLDSIANIFIDHSSFNNNGDNGIQIFNFNPGTVNMTVNHSTINGNQDDGLTISTFGGPFTLAVNNSVVDNNNEGISINNVDGLFNLTANNSMFNGNINGSGIGIINISGTFNLTANNSMFNGNNDDGIFAEVSGDGIFNLTVNNSTFNGNNNDGIFAESSGDSIYNLTVNNSMFNGNTNDGIFAQNASTGTFNLTANNSTFNGNNNGIFALDFGDDIFNLTVNNSMINGNTNDGISGNNEADGIFNLTVYNSTFNSNVNGIFAQNNSAGTFNLVATNSTFDANSNDGIYALNADPLNGIFNLTANNSVFSNNQVYGIEAHNVNSADIDTSQFINNPNLIILE